MEAWESRVQGHSQHHSDLEYNLGYRRVFLKNKKQNKKLSNPQIPKLKLAPAGSLTPTPPLAWTEGLCVRSRPGVRRQSRDGGHKGRIIFQGSQRMVDIISCCLLTWKT